MTYQILYNIVNKNTPMYTGSKFTLNLALKNLVTGYIDVQTEINYELIKGDIILTTIDTNILSISCGQVSDVVIKLSYTLDNDTVYETVSFVIIPKIYYPSLNDYLNVLNSELPQGFFKNNPLDVTSFGNLLIDAYNRGINNLSEAFPNVATQKLLYIQKIWSLIQPLYIGNPKFNLNDFALFMLRLTVYSSLNPFSLAWNISKFLYLISGTIYFVYASEVYSSSAPNYTIYIINPTASETTWILGESILGTSTILGGTTILSVYQKSIEFFIQKIIRASTNYTVNYTSTLDFLGLNNLIENTYQGDIRLKGVYCIGYNPNNFTGATGYINSSTFITNEIGENITTENNNDIFIEE